MPAITLEQLKQYVTTYKNNRLKRREGLFVRHDRFLPFLPKVAVPRSDIQTQYIKKLDAMLAFPDSETDDVNEIKFIFADQTTQTDEDNYKPVTLSTKKYVIDINIGEQTLQSLGADFVEGLVKAALKEVEYLACASIFYGGRTDSNGVSLNTWTGWPYQDASGDAYDPQLGPEGLCQLAEFDETGYRIDADASPLTLDLLGTLFAAGQMPEDRASCLLMNSDMLATYQSLWHAESGSNPGEAPRVAHPLDKKKTTAAFQGVPILLSNFISTYVADSGVSDHPDHVTNLETNASSVFAVHVNHEDPFDGLCLFYPEGNESFITLEERTQKDSKDQISYRINMEFGLFVSSNIDVVRLKKVACKTAEVS